MLHLFKKVYVESDTKVSVDYDRVVISERHGVPMLNALDQVSQGELVAYGNSVDAIVGEGKVYPTLIDLFTTLSARADSTGKKIIIFVDDATFLPLIVTWCKMLLPHAKAVDVHNVITSHLFGEEVFGDSRFSSSKITPEASSASLITLTDTEAAFNSIVIDATKNSAFVSTISGDVSIEYLFASYMFNASHKEELKSKIRLLIAKDLEKYLYELKEIILVHILHPRLQTDLSATGVYDISNLAEIVNDNSPLINVLFKPEIWSTTGLSQPSTSGTINFANITDADVELLREYTNIVGTIWAEEKFYSIVKSDIMKLDFIPFLRTATLSDAALTSIINFELVKEHAAGSYSSIDTGTVNHYLIDHVIYSYNLNEMDKIKPFTL